MPVTACLGWGHDAYRHYPDITDPYRESMPCVVVGGGGGDGQCLGLA